MKTFGFLSHLDLNLYLFRAPIMLELLRRGDKVYAICPKGEKNEALRNLGVEVINYAIERQSLNPLKEKQAIQNIYEAIKDLRLDLLHTFTAKPNIYGTLAARKAGVPIVLNLVEGLGSFYVKDTPKNILVRHLMEHLYKKAFALSDGCVFVNGDDPAYMVQKKLLPQGKVKIIKSVGVDTKKFSMERYTPQKLHAIKEKLGLENKKIVLMVARAIWDKGIKEYYDAAKIIHATCQDALFVFVGGTDVGNPSCAGETFLRSAPVLWLGHRDDIADLIAISDVFVLPSYREGFPVTLMEAASMGKPIVTTDTFGCKEAVEDGKNGFLVPLRDAKTLACKIELLLGDDTLRFKMGQSGREKALKEFASEKVVAQYMEYYETFF